MRTLMRIALLLEDLVHGRCSLSQRGPDLMPVDGLGDARRYVPDELADVLQRNITRAVGISQLPTRSPTAASGPGRRTS
jgi:hypothetical protein